MPSRSQVGLHPRHVLPGGVPRHVVQRRDVGGHDLARRHLAVEDPERVLVQAALAVGAQLGAARLQGGPDHVLVAGAVLGVAEVVEVDLEIGKPQPQEELVHRRQQLGVGQRRVGPDDLQADLGELAVPPVLHPLVPEHRPEVVHAQRLGAVAEAVLEPRPGDAGRPFRPQRERAPLAVGEGVHLLVHDVGGLAHRAHEQLGRLEHRGADLLPAERAEHLPGDRLHRLPEATLGRQEVAGAARPLDHPRLPQSPGSSSSRSSSAAM